jgi:hypothetical protein
MDWKTPNGLEDTDLDLENWIDQVERPRVVAKSMKFFGIEGLERPAT